MDYNNIRFFIPKLKNRIRDKRNLLWKYVDVSRISMKGYKSFCDAVIFKSRLQKMFGVYNANILSGLNTVDKTIILNSANQALNHEFDLLGSGPITLDPIDWHTDFKCGAKWGKKFYRDIKRIKGADIKVPWELSRCQHLLWLGEAFLLTDDTKYAQEVVDEINWWIDDNPLMYSVNWTCAMDVAFRAVNWMCALNMISGFDGFNDEFVGKVSSSLWQHGFYIINNLEKGIPYSNNHYTSDIVGLLYLGELFRETKTGNKWFKYSLKEFIAETRIQVLTSGVHYERSVSYHRMMTEMLSYPLYMLKRMDDDVPQDVLELIGKMYSYIATYTKPNGLAPLIADNDDGRFLPFLRRDFRQHNYLNDKSSVENCFMAAGLEPLFCVSNNGGTLYEDANVAIDRHNEDYLCVCNGGYSGNPKESDILISTHSHNDLLSFELCLNGQDIIVDAGAFLYTSSKTHRDSFRATAKHNTVVVDGEEQNELAAPFKMKRNVHIGKLRQVKEGLIEGAYYTIKGKMHHVRGFEFKNGRLAISDLIVKNGDNHKAVLFLHFANDMIPVINDKSLYLERGINISFNPTPAHLEVVDDNISPSYGVLVDSKTAVASFSFNNKINIETIINEG